MVERGEHLLYKEGLRVGDDMCQVMKPISIDLGSQLELSCGCKTMMGKILALAGLQHSTNNPIICPLHLCEHQFSHDGVFIRLAVVVAELFREASGLPGRRVIDIKVGDDNIEIVMSNTIPRFASIMTL